MNAQEYIEDVFTRHNIDWLKMIGDGQRVLVAFFASAKTIQAELDAIEGAFAEAHILPTDDRRCAAIITINPRKLEERTLTQALANILRSTRDLHQRFGTKQDTHKGLKVLLGEVAELQVEIEAGDRQKALHESVDVLVTLISLWRALNVSDTELIAMLDTVADKNDAKTDEHYVLHDDVITRRDKLV